MIRLMTQLANIFQVSDEFGCDILGDLPKDRPSKKIISLDPVAGHSGLIGSPAQAASCRLSGLGYRLSLRQGKLGASGVIAILGRACRKLDGGCSCRMVSESATRPMAGPANHRRAANQQGPKKR